MNNTPDHPVKKVSLVIPVYNEQEVIQPFSQMLRDCIADLPYDFTIYFIDDGSSDRTKDILDEMARTDDRILVVELSRNFGHQAALTAGMDMADGDIIITLDGDGQHPPELIADLLKLHEQGYDVVLTQRIDDQASSIFKRSTSAIFYWLINRLGDTRIVPGSADFRLLSRQVVDGLKQMREYHRFLRGMVAWMGYRTIILPYLPPARLGGKSKYSFKKMSRLSMDAVFSFSIFPLQISISLGFIFLFLALAEVIYVLNFWIRGQTSTLAPGWSSLMFMLLLVGGILMLGVGFIGIYVGYIFQEVKNRPIYLIRSVRGKQDQPAELKEEEKQTDSG